MKRRLNKKLLIWLVAVTLLLGGAVHGVHLLQARRAAGGLLRAADRAEAEQDLPRAASYLSRYLHYAPEDTDTMARFGQVLDKLGEKDFRKRERALFVLEQVL